MVEDSLAAAVGLDVQMVVLATDKDEYIALSEVVRFRIVEIFIGIEKRLIYTLWCVHIGTVRCLWRNTSRGFVEG